MVTAGLSEVALGHLRKVPHWVYFVENEMVYFSKAFDCTVNNLCVIKKTEQVKKQ